jgi:hypothetical protein
MIRLPALLFIALSAPALAHPGHIAAEAGHDHCVALGATVLAAAIVVIGIARASIRRRRRIAHG